MQSVLSVFVNERVWQGIPAADRKILEDAMAEVGLRSLEWDRASVAQYRKDLESKGMIFSRTKTCSTFRHSARRCWHRSARIFRNGRRHR